SGNFAVSQNTSSYGGMYVDTVPVNGFPFYGYSHNSVPIAYHYLDGGDNDTWKLINGGVLCLSAKHSRKGGIGTSTPGYELDVADRIRVRQGPSGTAGMWLYQTAPAANRAFVGMVNDSQVGLYGSAGAGWGMIMDTATGNVGIGTTDLQG